MLSTLTPLQVIPTFCIISLKGFGLIFLIFFKLFEILISKEKTYLFQEAKTKTKTKQKQENNYIALSCPTQQKLENPGCIFFS